MRADGIPRLQAREDVNGHVTTRWGLDHFIRGIPLEDLLAEQFDWRPGWEYRLDA